MLNARLCQFLTRPGGFATTWRAARWGMLLLVTGTACANSITVTISDSDDAPITKTLTSATGNYSISAANFNLFDFQGLSPGSIDGTIATNDIAGSTLLSSLQVSIFAIAVVPFAQLTVTVTDTNFRALTGDVYSGISQIGGHGSVAAGRTVRNEGDFNVPATAVAITSVSTDTDTFPTNSMSQTFTATQAAGALTIVDVVSGGFFFFEEAVLPLNGLAQATLVTPEPSSILMEVTGLIGLVLCTRIRRPTRS
jgi:hypothetical protein